MNQLMKDGKEIYKTNEHYRRLANVMEHPEFRQFYDKYMNDWSSVKTIVMFMKIYEAIEKHSDTVLSPYQKISIVKDVIEDPNLRQRVCEGIDIWCRGEDFDLEKTIEAKK